MSPQHVEIGEVLDERDHRNLNGWFILFGLTGLMIVMQLVSYFGRTPSSEVLVSKAEQLLKGRIVTSKLGPTPASGLDSMLQELRPKTTEPLVATAYAAVATEAKVPIKPGEIIVLKGGQEPADKAIYEIYTQPTLTPDRAKTLAAELPTDRFLYKLIQVQALEKAGDKTAREGLTDKWSSARLMLSGGLLLLILFGGFILILTYVVLRFNGMLKPLGFPITPLSLPDADRLVLRSAQIFIAFNAIGLFAALALRGNVSKEIYSLPIYLTIVASIVLLARVPIGGKWISLQSIGLSKQNLGRHVLWGVGAAIANAPILVVVMIASMNLMKSLPTPEHPTTVELTTTQSPWVILLALIMASVMAPFIEEIMFRGTMFPAFARAFRSPLWGALFSSFIFAAIHPTGIPVWPGLAAVGAMSCFLVYQTKSLVPSMVMHATHNFGTLLFLLLTMK